MAENELNKLVVSVSKCLNSGLSQEDTAKTLQITRYRVAKTIEYIKEIEKQKELGIEEIDECEEPIEELLERRKKAFERSYTAYKNKQWHEVAIKNNLPIAIAYVGDPHVDDDGCNLHLLERHLRIINKTDGFYALNVGDTTNNWRNKMAFLAKEQGVNVREEFRLAEWMLSQECWVAHILGNHDLWSGDPNPIKMMTQGKLARVESWNVKFTLKFKNNIKIRVWAAHDFPGHSIYNPNHAMKRASLYSANIADVYVAGHRHNWSLQQNENEHTNEVSTFIRARGYKFIDDFAAKRGHGSQIYGASVVTIIDPNEDEDGRVITTPSITQAAFLLEAMRERYKKQK